MGPAIFVINAYFGPKHQLVGFREASSHCKFAPMTMS